MDAARRSRYLEALSIPEWRRRVHAASAAGGAAAGIFDSVDGSPAGAPEATGAVPLTATAAEAGTAGPGPAAAPNARLWTELMAEVSACTACALHRGRTQTVFGVGDRRAALMVIGEAPGADEDRQGEPFVGRAGKLLNAMLRSLGISREAVYIANILKCRPPNNRDPSAEESATCTRFLDRQIDLVRPAAILAVGRIPAQWLLDTDTPIGRLRGRVHEYERSQTPLVVTYHPAYLLRSPLAKAKSWQDLLLVREFLGNAK